MPGPHTISHATDETFKTDVLESKGAVVVDFWAPWCAPCRTLGATLEAVAPEFDGAVRVVKVNVDENPATSEQFGIRSIPALFFFKDGAPIGATAGALPAEALRDLFTRHAAGTLSAERQ